MMAQPHRPWQSLFGDWEEAELALGKGFGSVKGVSDVVPALTDLFWQVLSEVVVPFVAWPFTLAGGGCLLGLLLQRVNCTLCWATS